LTELSLVSLDSAYRNSRDLLGLGDRPLIPPDNGLGRMLLPSSGLLLHFQSTGLGSKAQQYSTGKSLAGI